MPRWTEESRRKQAETAKRTQPWLNSTGPRTKRGKNRCKMNATRHGYRSRGYRELCEALRAQAKFVREMRAALASFDNAESWKRWSRASRNTRIIHSTAK